jgi:hypothetical protein
MKTNDITVCAFPKSGITYLGFLLSSARLKHNKIDLRPTFYNIDWLLIDTHKWIGHTPAFPWKDGVGDLFKTHERRDALSSFTNMNVIYLLRNPVNTLASYFHFRRQLGSKDTMDQFLMGPMGIPAWNAHVKSWLIDNRNPSQSLYLLEYESLVADPAHELHRLTDMLGFSFSDELVKEAVHWSTLAKMRLSEQAFVQSNPVYARFNLQFVRPPVLLKDAPVQRVVDELTPELRGGIIRLTDETYRTARGLP